MHSCINIHVCVGCLSSMQRSLLVECFSVEDSLVSPPKVDRLDLRPHLCHTFCLSTISRMKLATAKLVMYQSIPFGTFQWKIPLPKFLPGLDLRFSNVTSEAAFCGDFFRERYSVGLRFHVVSNDLRTSSLTLLISRSIEI